MVKKRVDLYIPKAYKVLQQVGIAKDDKVNAGYRSQIASFGAMIAMGSILSAVALLMAKSSTPTISLSAESSPTAILCPKAAIP